MYGRDQRFSVEFPAEIFFCRDFELLCRDTLGFIGPRNRPNTDDDTPTLSGTATAPARHRATLCVCVEDVAVQLPLCGQMWTMYIYS